MWIRRRWCSASVVLAVLLVAGACGGGSGSVRAGSATTVDASTATAVDLIDEAVAPPGTAAVEPGGGDDMAPTPDPTGTTAPTTAAAAVGSRTRFFVVDGVTTQVLTTLEELPESASLVAVRPAFVIDTGDGPRACLTGARLSAPPQCSGPRLIGLDIATLPDLQTQGTTRWTNSIDVRFTGSWDGVDITLTEEPEHNFETVIQDVSVDAPVAPQGFAQDQLAEIQDQMSAVLSSEKLSGSVGVRNGWVTVNIGIVDRNVAALFAAAVEDPSPIMLTGNAELLG